MKQKMAFHLFPEDGWPPVEVEHLWLEDVGRTDRILKSIPFFVPKLSLNDHVRLSCDDNGEVRAFEVVKKAANSTIWLAVTKKERKEEIYESLTDMSVAFESMKKFPLIAVSLPVERPLEEFDKIFSPLESSGVLDIAYPSMRHEE